MSVQPNSEELPTIFEGKVKLAAYIEQLRHGGSYFPLFVRRLHETQDVRTVILGNAWLVSSKVKAELEGSKKRFDSGDYFHRGFHPALWESGWPKRKFWYAPIYGGEQEPLVLGWSADEKTVDASLSQEFERFYNLSMVVDHTTRWDSLEEGIDGVVIRELRDNEGFVVAHLDFVRDYQDVRRKWLLLAYYGQWLRLPYQSRGNQKLLRKEIHKKNSRRELYFGRLDQDGPDFAHLQMWGYILLAPPAKPQFTRKWAGPPSVTKLTKGIYLHTSDGDARPADVKSKRDQSKFFMSTVAFHQEVLRKYQEQPGSQASVRHLKTLDLKTRDLHIFHDFYLLGTDYIWTLMENFVTSVPQKEWPHWQSHNIPYPPNEILRDMDKQETLFDFVGRMSALTSEISSFARRLTAWKTEPIFEDRGPNQKDKNILTMALARNTSAAEFLLRAQALNSFVLERLSAHRLRALLSHLGYDSKELKQLQSLKLFTTFAAIIAITSRALTWAREPIEATKYAVARMVEWKLPNEQRPPEYEEDFLIVDRTLARLEAIFAIYDLRLLSAHNITPEVQDAIRKVMNEHLSIEVNTSDYRDLTIRLYKELIRCLEFVSELPDGE